MPLRKLSTWLLEALPLTMNIVGIAFIGYPVTDVPRARKFYEETLGLKLLFAHEMPDNRWWIEYDVGGNALAISNLWPPSGQSGPGVALEIEDLDAALADLTDIGVSISHEIMESPSCRFFSIKDPDGNDITLHQRNASQS
jgi:predicted enzyme related to lactoylglutathione lyase